MGHPLRHYNPHNQLGNSADFSQYDIVDDSDFTQDKFTMGDFSNYGEELDDELLSGFGDDEDFGRFKARKFKRKLKFKRKGFGEYDGQLGDYDEGFGRRRRFRIKRPKISIKPKAIVKSVTKIAAKATPTAIINKALPPVVKKELQKAAMVASAIPGVSQAMAVAQQAAKIADKVGIPASSMVKLVAPQQASVQSESIPEEAIIEQAEHTLVTPAQSSSQVVSQGKPLTANQLTSSVPASVGISTKNIHPMVAMNNKIMGFGEYDGFLDDLLTKAKTEAAKLYEAQKAKITQTLQTQATNLVGKTLDKLNVTDPKAQAALSQTIATATSAATTAAQQTAMQKAKEALEQNKKYIYMAGAGIGALVLFNMLKKK